MFVSPSGWAVCRPPQGLIGWNFILGPYDIKTNDPSSVTSLDLQRPSADVSTFTLNICCALSHMLACWSRPSEHITAQRLAGSTAVPRWRLAVPGRNWLIAHLCWTGLRGSLSRLQLDYVDIVFANRNDVNSPMEGELWGLEAVSGCCGFSRIARLRRDFDVWCAEIVRAMTFVINQGMAMYWGTSRWSAMEIMVSVNPPFRGAHASEN